MCPPIIFKICQRSCVVSVSILELNTNLLLAWLLFPESDAVEMQPQLPWQLFNCKQDPRGADNLRTRFYESLMDFGNLWAFLRSLAPAFLKETPNQIIKHAIRPRGNCVFLSISPQSWTANPPVWLYPSQNLGILCEICLSCQSYGCVPRRRLWPWHTRHSPSWTPKMAKVLVPCSHCALGGGDTGFDPVNHNV